MFFSPSRENNTFILYYISCSKKPPNLVSQLETSFCSTYYRFYNENSFRSLSHTKEHFQLNSNFGSPKVCLLKIRSKHHSSRGDLYPDIFRISNVLELVIKVVNTIAANAPYHRKF